MKNLDGDAKLEYLAGKINKGEHLTNEDILTLTLVPLMSGKEEGKAEILIKLLVKNLQQFQRNIEKI